MTADFKSILKQIQGEHNSLTKDSNVLLIDGLNTFLRTWSVNPSLNEVGEHIGGVVGFYKSIGFAIKKFNPTRCIIVFDGKGGSQRRRKLFPEYKANRKNKLRVNRAYELHTDEDERASMKRQLVTIARLMDHLPVSIMVYDNIEADDVIAYLAKQIYSERDSLVTIMSSDKDFLQLVNDDISVWSPTKKKLYTPEEVFAEYGIPAHNFLMGKILMGDKSDNVSGIKGIGYKTIHKRLPILLGEDRMTIDDVVNYADWNRGKLKIYDSIVDNRDKLVLNHKLMQLDNVDISGITKIKIINAVDMEVSKFSKFHLIMKMSELGVMDGFPFIHNWAREVFTTLDRFARDGESVNDK